MESDHIQYINKCKKGGGGGNGKLIMGSLRYIWCSVNKNLL